MTTFSAEDFILSGLQKEESLDSITVCKQLQKEHPEVVKDHQQLHSILLTLAARNIITLENLSEQQLVLTQEGELYRQAGSPEFKYAQIFSSKPTMTRAELNELYASTIQNQYPSPLPMAPQALAGICFGKAKSLGYISLNKQGMTLGDISHDKIQELLIKFECKDAIDPKDLSDIKKRGLVEVSTVKWFRILKGNEYVASMSLAKPLAAELTEDMVKTGDWKNVQFTPLNFEALGSKVASGHEHPLLKVRGEFRQIFLSMGFEEMDTSRWVESSFWNFDSLFQGQQHPCRDMHDTFFISDPEECKPIADQEYFARVKKMHEEGGDGSIGLRYNFDNKIPLTNIMRTHTTACSSRHLKAIADELKRTGEIRPRKFFSIDRVYRNETLDATHLAEFHQVEGFVLDKNLSLADLMNYAREFFARIGLEDIEFKPAYNPYTEPSMEIFCYHPGLKKQIEIGNSGMFRPEMLQPMGLPQGWNVIAWGFSLERPTMIEYKIDEIRKLEGPNVSLELVENVPICRLTF